MLKVFLIIIGLLVSVLLIGAAYIYWQYKSVMKYQRILGNSVTTLHRLAREGDLKSLQDYLNSDDFDQQKINELDLNGATPLAYAISREQDSLRAVKLLADAGADIRLQPGEELFNDFSGSPMKLAVKKLNLPVIKYLVEQGVDLHKVEKGNYNVAINFSYDSVDKPLDSILPVLDYFIDQNFDIDLKTKYNESTINAFYSFNRFDVLTYFKNKDFDLSSLNLSALMLAILFDDNTDVEALLNNYQQQGTLSQELSHRAHWQRTPLIVATLLGDIEKTRLLLDYGVDIESQGRFKQTLPFYAVKSNNPQMLAWLLNQHNFDLSIKNEQGTDLLTEAVTRDKVEATSTLLQKGLNVNQQNEYDYGVLYDAETAQMAKLLLSHGADPKDLTNEIKRLLLGLPAESTDEYSLLTRDDYLAGRHVEYGKDNPTRIEDKFKLTMIKSGASPWHVTQLFDPDRDIYETNPVWTVERHGQSFTRLPDGRVIEIGGEHEDYYDPDFQIYNDVIVHDGKGNIALYAYPKEAFPPTDFHTATLIDDKIYIIGCLGYDSKSTITPVYQLDINNYRIEKIETSGQMPSRIYAHRAVLVKDDIINISGGNLDADNSDEEIRNETIFELDLNTHQWSIVN